MRGHDTSAAKHARILQAAVELFTKRDFPQALMDDVKECADIGKGVVYRYFPAKPVNTLAFRTEGNPFNVKLHAIMGLDIGHFHCVDTADVLTEAHERSTRD